FLLHERAESDACPDQGSEAVLLVDHCWTTQPLPVESRNECAALSGWLRVLRLRWSLGNEPFTRNGRRRRSPWTDSAHSSTPSEESRRAPAPAVRSGLSRAS